jgi:hypothetical protein
MSRLVPLDGVRTTVGLCKGAMVLCVGSAGCYFCGGFFRIEPGHSVEVTERLNVVLAPLLTGYMHLPRALHARTHTATVLHSRRQHKTRSCNRIGSPTVLLALIALQGWAGSLAPSFH